MKNKSIVDKEAMDLVEKTFSMIGEAKTKQDLQAIPEILSFNHRYNEQKYPCLQLSFSKQEVKVLCDHFEEKSVGELQQVIDNPVAKLLYALGWKQGDLQKIVHIVQGMREKEKIHPSKAVVFHQFGRHLVNKEEPIIDQHVLRAFAALKLLNDENKFATVRSETKFEYLIDEYKGWYFKHKLKENGAPAALDQLLFGLGKSIKVSK